MDQSTAPAPPDPTTIIQLQVGERRFTTKVSTLTDGSTYFESLFSGRWTPQLLPDGAYFVDSDGDTFVDVLCFLRLGVYPLYYDMTKGHKYEKYAAVGSQADFLGIEPLADWIKKEGYRHVIKVGRSAVRVRDLGDMPAYGDSESKVVIHPVWTKYDKYICPRGIPQHAGAKMKCGRACMQAQGDAPDEYREESILEAVVHREFVSADLSKCRI